MRMPSSDSPTAISVCPPTTPTASDVTTIRRGRARWSPMQDAWQAHRLLGARGAGAGAVVGQLVQVQLVGVRRGSASTWRRPCRYWRRSRPPSPTSGRRWRRCCISEPVPPDQTGTTPFGHPPLEAAFRSVRTCSATGRRTCSHRRCQLAVLGGGELIVAGAGEVADRLAVVQVRQGARQVLRQRRQGLPPWRRRTRVLHWPLAVPGYLCRAGAGRPARAGWPRTSSPETAFAESTTLGMAPVIAHGDRPADRGTGHHPGGVAGERDRPLLAQPGHLHPLGRPADHQPPVADVAAAGRPARAGRHRLWLCLRAAGR